MKKGLFTVLLVLLFSVMGFSQWTYQGAWPDTVNKGGAHGVVITPDGKIWTASYYQTLWPEGGINTAPIIIFNSNGSIDDTIFTVTTGLVTDTLGKGGATSGCRGLAIDPSGNVYYVSAVPGKVIKINYQTRLGMARHDIGGTELGSSPAGPAISADGTVYIGPVVGGGTTAIATYDTDLNYLGSAVTGPPNIARTFTVSSDGLAIYWTTFTGSQGIYIYKRPDELSAFVLADSALQGMSIESVAWNSATGLLWVSNDSRGLGPYGHLRWYGLDVTTKALVDSFTLPSPDPVPADELPRALRFSPDGTVAYVGLFGNKYPRLFKFNKVTGIGDEGQVVVNGYKLSQNYPNPFNPSTKISFELPMSGYTTLKVYDMLGSEVAVLIQEELALGSHSVNFDAANLSTGTYIYQLNVNGTRITNKMILLK